MKCDKCKRCEDCGQPLDLYPNWPLKEPCLFDGLEPGVYGISCPCPKCSPNW